MATHDIIVVGASAGGVEALSQLVSGLAPDLPAAVFVVLHISAHAPSVLPKILTRAGPLPAIHPQDGEPIRRGRIYVAPPDLHLLVDHDRVRLVPGPRENRHRPAVDPLFRTAAYTCGPRTVGVVLTGALDDGTAGLFAVKRRGGIAVVQDPTDAMVASMPASALAHVTVDQCLPLARIAGYLNDIATQTAPPEEDFPVSDELRLEAEIAGLRPDARLGQQQIGHLSMFTCPECKGPLWEMHDDQLLRFRCRVGHAYTAESLVAGQSDAVNDALWTAMETLEQNSDVAARLARQARDGQQTLLAERFERKAQKANEQARVIREVLMGAARATSQEDRTEAEAEMQMSANG